MDTSNAHSSEAASVPNGWHATTIGDVADIFSGATPSTEVASYWDGEIPWCIPTDITGTPGKYLLTTERNITHEGLVSSGASLLPEGSLLLCSRATIGDVKIAATTICTNQGFKSLVCKDGVSNEFLYYLIQPFKPRMVELATGSTFRELSKRDLGNITVALPPLPEQRAIAAVLSDIDGMLDALDALIAKKQDIKKATMQQLLTGETRLPDFSGEWETKRLGDMVSIRNQRVLPSNVDADTLCVELDHIGQDNGQLLVRSTSQDSSSMKCRFFAGDVLFGRLRSYLRKFWHADDNGICTTEIWPLMTDVKQMDDGFLYAIVQSDQFLELSGVSYGTHMPRADWDVLQELDIILPDLPEQRAIAAVLSDMDAEIAALEERRDKTSALKQGMMQELLTGRIRLPATE